jgi:gamma-glutamylputrescine oxidase
MITRPDDRRPDASPLTRRDVLKRLGVAAAGVTTGSVALNGLAPRIWPEHPCVDRNVSHWAEAIPAAGAALDRSTEADVAIVGGGFTGLSAAWYLRRRLPGRRVVLLEAQRCGNGASGRNGAMLLPSTADRFLKPGAVPALDRRIHELTVANIAVLRDLCAATGIDADIELSGAATVLRTAAEARAAATDVAKLLDAGIAAELWSRDRTVASLGTDAYAGAAFVPDAGQLHPGKMVAVWKRAAVAAGVQIYEHTTVAHVDEGATHTLTTDSGHTVRAPALVLATNAYSTQLGFLRRAFVPVWDYVAITAPLPANQLSALGWPSRIPFADTRTEVYYYGVTRDNRVHIGGGPVDYLFNAGAPAAPVIAHRRRELHRSLARLHPSLEQVPLETAWGGLVDMSLDESPAVGRCGRHGNVYYATGFSGHGVNLTSVFGHIIADLIAGEDERWHWLPYLNRLPPYIPNEPFRWLGVHASLAAIRALDL